MRTTTALALVVVTLFCVACTDTDAQSVALEEYAVAVSPPDTGDATPQPDYCREPRLRAVASDCGTPVRFPHIDLPEDAALRARGLQPITTNLHRRVWCRRDDGAVVACKPPRRPVVPVGRTREADCLIYGWQGPECDGILPPKVDASLAAEEADPVDLKHGKDLSCGAGAYRVSTVDGPILGAESCAYSQFHGRFLCTVAATPEEGTSRYDGFGFITQAFTSGQFWSPVEGVGDPVGWSSYAWTSQWGGDYGSANPLGIAVSPTGTIYVVEGGHLDWDLDNSTPPSPAILVYGPDGEESHAIPVPGILTINDVTRSPLGTLYVTDSAFADAAQSAIWAVVFPDDPVAAFPFKWLDVPQHPRPNPLKARWFDNGDGIQVETLFVATLGTNIVIPPTPQVPHNGHLFRVSVPTGQTWLLSSGHFADGLFLTSYITERVAVADLWKRTIELRNPKTGALSSTIDLSSYSYQLGGMDRGPQVPLPSQPPQAIFVAEYGAGRNDVLRVGN